MAVAERKYRWHTDYDGKTPGDPKPPDSLTNRRKDCLDSCPDHAKELITFLSESGTGVSKLEALVNIAVKCKDNPELFVERAAKMVPSGTVDKINKYFADKRLGEAASKVNAGKSTKPT